MNGLEALGLPRTDPTAQRVFDLKMRSARSRHLPRLLRVGRQGCTPQTLLPPKSLADSNSDGGLSARA